MSTTKNRKKNLQESQMETFQNIKQKKKNDIENNYKYRVFHKAI